MRLIQLRVRGFRCFSSTSETVLSLRDMTCLIGPNASGKTSVLMALQRMFGTSRAERQVQPEDFHLRDGERLEDQPSRDLRLEVKFEFPGLDGDEHPENLPDVAATFSQMVVTESGGSPFVRIELCATWTDDGTTGGSIEEQVRFVCTASDDSEEIDNHAHKVNAADRALIRVLYVPAVRDPDTEVRATAGTALHRLLRSVSWSDGTETAIQNQLTETRNSFSAEPAMQYIGKALQTRWSALYHGKPFAQVILSPTGITLDDIVKQIRAFFRASDDAPELNMTRLCDGLRSLFSLSFTASILDIEQQLLDSASEMASAFDVDRVRPPLLTLLCVEEPENHLSPQHLGRVLQELRSIANRTNGQVVITSHSPAVLSRIDPTEIRYCRGDERMTASTIRELALPQDGTEAFKFIKEAVQAQPEVYFARLVVLGEGPSEQVAIPRILQAADIDLDIHQVVVVPLGGRHVHHYWRLLKQLDVSYITLLDLDFARAGGGWERLHNLYTRLQKFGADVDDFYCIEHDHGRADPLIEFNLNDIRSWSLDEDFDDCIKNLETFGVFLSSPLDLDLLMLSAFTDKYKSVATTNPNIPDEPERQRKYLIRATRAVLGDGVTPETLPSDSYTQDQIALFPWYRSLFLHSSKPATHHHALLRIEDNVLIDNLPNVLDRLIAACREQLALLSADEDA